MTKVEIFSSPECTYCDRAKLLLMSKNIAYIDYDIAADGACRQDLIARLPRSRSLPQIFIGGEHIGSYEDLTLLDKSGRLQELTTASG